MLRDKNYLSFARVKSFLERMLFHNLGEVSIRFGGTVFFLKWYWGDMSQWGNKKISGGDLPCMGNSFLRGDIIFNGDEFCKGEVISRTNTLSQFTRS